MSILSLNLQKYLGYGWTIDVSTMVTVPVSNSYRKLTVRATKTLEKCQKERIPLQNRMKGPTEETSPKQLDE